MIYRARNHREIWDPYVMKHGDTWYMIHMVRGNPVEGRGQSRVMCLATSTNGVHWQEHGPIIDRRGKHGSIAAGTVWRTKDRFILNHGSSILENGKARPCIRLYESPDMLNWKPLANGQDVVTADPAWYHIRRWDCMNVAPRFPGRNDCGYYGYLSAHALDDWPHYSIGMLQSQDGIHWEAIPPPVIEWGNIPQQNTETGTCRKIGDQYYLLLGARHGYMGHEGYSMIALRSDSPTGPFRPDAEALRLCGTSKAHGTYGYNTWLGRFCDVPGEDVLFSNWLSWLWRPEREEPGAAPTWFSPLQRAIVDKGGHLRLAYWEGNEALKGDRLPVDLGRCVQAFPAQATEDALCKTTPQGVNLQAVSMDAVRQRAIHSCSELVVVDQTFDLARGVILEGKMTATDTTLDMDAARTHVTPVTAGFFIESEPGRGTAMLFQSYGITKIGRLDCTGAKPVLEELDQIGPGCAQVAGIPSGKACSFRLMVRHDMFELYLNDLHVQSHYLGPNGGSGRLGFFVQDGRCAFADLVAWSMNLADKEPDRTVPGFEGKSDT